MVYLLDTNIIIRFLVGDHKEHLEKSIKIFKDIEKAKLQVEILDGVLMEAYFVLVKFYKLPRVEVINDLKTILSLNGVVNSNKVIIYEALNIIENKNIDFVDAMICAKSKLQGFGKLSFDKDLKKCK
ncbi:PIN domain-containing protein [Sulfurimonas sp.]|uniref:PIN domain-containing protein n=1 Tax=Sulfurimonas sp. TaxID=2022749 RepID=UPI002AB31785|nr:PIN domain-containing protein [Sulfurimonas sp.]